MRDKKRVIILCTGNSARSQMAEGWLRHIAGDRFEVHSAGSDPSGYVHPQAIAAMANIGVDIQHHSSKSMNQFLGQSFDYIITVCDQAAEVCPYFPGDGQRYHNGFTDPAAAPPDQQPAVFSRVRDRIIEWLAATLDLPNRSSE
ncbi:MAG: arsenate reductase ArsC [Anaerolineales bacterium]